MLGDAIVDNYTCPQHDLNDDENLVALGKTSLGHPVRVNRTYMDADVKILTGFIEPHFFAGFSGGPKAVLPAIAGPESVVSNHGYAMIGHGKARRGVTKGNPIWEEMLEVALRTDPSFLSERGAELLGRNHGRLFRPGTWRLPTLRGASSCGSTQWSR